MDPASINQFAKAEIKNIYNSFVNPWYVNLYHGMTPQKYKHYTAT